MESLQKLRKKIDSIDRKIVDLLLLRFGLVKNVGKYKKTRKIKIQDKKRELRIIDNVQKSSGKNKEIISQIFKKIIDYSKKLQK